MISDLERLAALHQNGQLDDAEFKLAKEKLLNGGNDNELVRRVELLQCQQNLDSLLKAWPEKAKMADAIVKANGTVMAPHLFYDFCLLVFCTIFLLLSVYALPHPRTWSLDLSTVSIYWCCVAIVSFLCCLHCIRSLFTCKARLQRFLAAQSEHNAEQSALRNRIAQLQQQLT